MVMIWIICWTLSFVTCCKNSTCKFFGKHQYFALAISTVGPIFTLVIHLPYIAIAYLNDAAYATSTFIYYTVVLFVKNMKTAKMSCYIAIAILLMYSTGIIYAKERIRDFGDCLEGKDSCSECYLALKESLLSRDDNIQNLSAAFYPSNANLPIFVTVTYNFNTSAVWYWTTDSAYLFF